MSKRLSHKQKGPLNEKPLEKILEVSGQLQYTNNQPPRSNRVTMTSLVSGYQRRAEKGSRQREEKKVSGFEANTIEEKDKMIRSMQEEIIDQKFKNDMIQNAFRARQQASTSHEGQKYWFGLFETLLKGCVQIAVKDKNLRKNALAVLVNAVRGAKKEKSRGMKILLVWVIGWVTRLFSILSGPLIKK